MRNKIKTTFELEGIKTKPKSFAESLAFKFRVKNIQKIASGETKKEIYESAKAES